MTMTPAIEIVGLTKPYGDQAVLGGVDLDVPSGTIVALLGSNGAGKTTVVKIYSTLLKADGGTGSRQRVRPRNPARECLQHPPGRPATGPGRDRLPDHLCRGGVGHRGGGPRSHPGGEPWRPVAASVGRVDIEEVHLV